MRLALLVLGLTTMGCANAASLPKPPATESAADPRSIVVHETKHGLVFVRGDGTGLTEDEFRVAYRAETGSSQLDDELAAATLHKKGLIAVGTGVGLTAGSVTLLTLTSCKGNGKCEEGQAALVLLAASGLYVLGCEAISGARCVSQLGMTDIKPAHLDRERAELYADRYNDALAGVKLDDDVSVTAPPSRPQQQPKRALLTLTPGGVNGTF